MNPRDAFYHLVHDYPGGAPALAPRLGMNLHTLEKKADPACTTHKPALMEVIAAEQLTGDHRPFHAHADALGYLVLRRPALDHVALPDLLREVTRFSKELGEALESMHKALADGRVTENEIRAFEKQVADIAPAAAALSERMRCVAAEQSRQRSLHRVA